jgi:uncharacterized heparinase superfamily protein
VVIKYWQTLRHLRPVQIYGRVWFRFKRPRPDHTKAPDLRVSTGSWKSALARPASMLGEQEFMFLNERGKLAGPADWNDPHREKLWLYNLHYFDDLNASNASNRKDWHEALIDRWIADNLPGIGNGWEPYPLSLRIINWIKWALAGNELTLEARLSLAVQIRFLRARLEWHLLGNHLFANAKALLFAGLFFEGDEADAWRAKGLEILAREIPEQILADGGQFELSPMYHSIVLEDILDMINMARAFPNVILDAELEEWQLVEGKMRAWQFVMQHPDGRISFFNDAAFGVAADIPDIEAYAKRLGLPLCSNRGERMTHLAQSGYIRVEQGEAVALLDVARIGPDYLPGHAHADTLSFELSLFGQRLFVNSGISQYGTGPERLRQRSTAAHNTLELDGENSSEVWGGFRVARRAYPVDLKLEEQKDYIVIGCAHNGYQRLLGQPNHKREWCFRPGSLTVSDEIAGCDRYNAIIRYHLPPDVETKGSYDEGHFDLASGERIKWQVERGRARICNGTWHPEFGRSVANQCLEVTMTGSDCTTTFTW